MLTANAKHDSGGRMRWHAIDANHRTNGFQPLASFHPPRRATLLRRFTLVSLATTIVIGVLFGVITAQLVESFALRQQARAIADQVTELAASRLVLEDFLQSPPGRRPQVEQAMRELAGKANIVHITLWSNRAKILYSDEPQAPDRTPAVQTGIGRALKGQLQWSLRPPQATRRSGPVLEVLIPVMVPRLLQPVAVYQVLADLSGLAPALARLIWSVQISVVLGVLVLYAALFAIVRASSADLERKESALRWAFTGIIRSLVNALDVRDMATAHHSSRVAERAVEIARAMQISEATVNEVQAAAFLHDVGKIGIADQILLKPDALTEAERAIVERHAVLGYDILDPVAIPEGIKLAVRHSHERWDGRGYPDGLAGTAIPLAARIVAVVDAYEALTTDRPYRAARRPPKAMEEIKRSAGTQFDPQVVEAALRIWKRSADGRGMRVVGQAPSHEAGQ